MLHICNIAIRGKPFILVERGSSHNDDIYHKIVDQMASTANSKPLLVGLLRMTCLEKRQEAKIALFPGSDAQPTPI